MLDCYHIGSHVFFYVFFWKEGVEIVMNSEIPKENNEDQRETTENNEKQRETTRNKDFEIVRLLGKRPELRKELISFVKSEFGFNVEGVLEEYFGELPDKRYDIADVDTPMREIAESVFEMLEDGYSEDQIASDMGLHRNAILGIVRKQAKWKVEIRKATRQKVKKNMPWYLRPLARFVPV